MPGGLGRGRRGQMLISHENMTQESMKERRGSPPLLFFLSRSSCRPRSAAASRRSVRATFGLRFGVVKPKLFSPLAAEENE